MILIAHRGLMDGPDGSAQNHPDQIRRALDAGFDAEIDLWLIDGRWMLGHDGPEHEVDLRFISYHGLWLHCKNLPAFFALRAIGGNHNYFFHDSDMVVLTSKGQVWTYFGKPETRSPGSICVMPEVTYDWSQIRAMVNGHAWLGMCSDWVNMIRGMVVKY